MNPAKLIGIAASITPTLVEYERIKKLDGKLPQVQGGATPFVNLPAQGGK